MQGSGDGVCVRSTSLHAFPMSPPGSDTSFSASQSPDCGDCSGPASCPSELSAHFPSNFRNGRTRSYLKIRCPPPTKTMQCLSSQGSCQMLKGERICMCPAVVTHQRGHLGCSHMGVGRLCGGNPSQKFPKEESKWCETQDG